MDEILQKKRIEYFKNKNVEVHISRRDGSFYNGSIISIKEDYFEIRDRKQGLIPVFWEEVYPDGVSEFREAI